MKEDYSEKGSIEEYAGQVRNSDRTAFNNLFALLWEPMYVYAASIVPDHAVAEDLVQEVWIDYWQRREEVHIRHIKSYLYKAIRYKCYNALRDTKFNEIQIETARAIHIPSEVELEEDLTELSGRINDIISCLPDRCQEIFVLSRIHNISNKEIAEQLKISQRSVENQLSVALRKLREELSVVKIFFF
ncbi:RNA polymerase sigma-70 factor [Sinomicrobium sp. M5D2P17]